MPVRSPPSVALAVAVLLAVACQGGNEPTPCAAGETRCGGVCFDLRSNPNMCGSCFAACPQGASCVDGVCGCPAGQVACGDACVDPSADPANCGQCGVACGEGTCVESACVCAPPPVQRCDGASPRCVDTATDPASCGACGVACAQPAPDCVDGACACAAPRQVCGGTRCTDVRTDEANCGACGRACTKPGTQCLASVCRCPGTLADCPSGCRDTSSDEASCGACGHACVAGQTCVGGACACGPSQRACPQAGGQEVVCCPGSGCQTVHPNGLGQDYYDCLPLDAHTRGQAEAAALAWGATTVQDQTSCGLSCLCGATSSAAAVWCYAGSPLRGYAVEVPSPNCFAACPFQGQNPWR